MDLSLDGLTPRRVARPQSTDELTAVVRGINNTGEAAVVWGSGTRIGIGAPLSRYDVAIDTTALRGVVEHSPADLVCTVRAGTTLAELADALAPSRQRWPLGLADPSRATVGGTIASAAASPSRLRFQHPRDWIIGCSAVLGDGTLARAGGRVVKNVTGYDLTRLYSGSYGTLAVLAEVSLKLIAVDETTSIVRIRNDPDRTLEQLDLEAMALDFRRLPFEAIVYVGGREPALYLRASGIRGAVERILERARQVRAADVGDVAWSALGSRINSEEHVTRLSVPPGREIEFAVGECHAYVGTGYVFLFGRRPIEELKNLRARCEAAGGALVLERGSIDDKRALGVWGKPRVPSAIAHALKQRFDPSDVLAPGRMPA